MKLFRRLMPFVIFSALALVTLASQERGLTAVARQIVGKTDFDIGKQYALIIGIDKYQEWTPLKDAVSEAKKVKEILDRRYYIDEFIELYDKDATAGNIRKMLTQTLPAKISKNDSLLIFYSGHGNLDESKTGSWIAVDGTTDTFDQKGWIPNQQLRNMIGLIKAQRVLVMADACFSGDFLNTSRGAAPTINNTYYQTALQKTARQVLTSGASETVPDQSEFGSSLLNMLERNNDPVLDTNAMFVKIRTSVTKTQPLIGTIPGDDNGTFALFLKPQFGLVRLSSIADAKIVLDDAEVGTISAGATITLPKMAAGSHNLSLVIGSQKDTKQIVLAPDQELAVSFNFKPVLPGSIAVTAAATAEVFLDGKSVGQILAGTPLNLDKLIEGDHLVSLKYRDNQEDRKVAVLGGQTSPVSFNYTPEPLGSVKFTGFPEGAIITSGGKELGAIEKGVLTVSNVRVGTRSFQVSYDSWTDVLSLRASITDGQITSLAFAGAQILVDRLPEGASVSVDGQVLVRSGSERRNLVLGPFPEGDHSVTVAGSEYETYRKTVSLSAGKDASIRLQLQARQQAIAPTTGGGAATGLFKAGVLLVSTDKGQDGKLDIQVRRLSDTGAQSAQDTQVAFRKNPLESYFAGDWISVGSNPLTLPPGQWLVKARRAEDSDDTYWKVWDLKPGDVAEVALPVLGFSLPWQIVTSSKGRDEARAKYLTAQGRRDLFDAIGTGSTWAMWASFGASAYGWYASFTDQQAYQSATTRTEAFRLHNAVVFDSNLAVWGLVSGAYLWLQSFIGQVAVPELSPSLDAFQKEQFNLTRLQAQGSAP